MPRKQSEPPTFPTPPAVVAAAEELFEKSDAPPVQEELGGPIPSAPDIKRRPVKMELQVDLTTDELIAAVNQFSKLQADLDAHQSHAEAVKADLKSKEANINNAVNTVVAKITSKKELREVVVEKTTDFAANAYYEVRTDTGAEIPGSRRALTSEERQRELGLKVEDKRKNDVSSHVERAREAIRFAEEHGASVEVAFGGSKFAVSSGKASEEEPEPDEDDV